MHNKQQDIMIDYLASLGEKFAEQILINNDIVDKLWSQTDELGTVREEVTHLKVVHEEIEKLIRKLTSDVSDGISEVKEAIKENSNHLLAKNEQYIKVLKAIEHSIENQNKLINSIHTKLETHISTEFSKQVALLKDIDLKHKQKQEELFQNIDYSIGLLEQNQENSVKAIKDHIKAISTNHSRDLDRIKDRLVELERKVSKGQLWNYILLCIIILLAFFR